MLKSINVLIRLIAAVHLTLVAGIQFQGKISPELMPLADKMGGRAKYLTIWANVITGIYFWLALLHDLISGCKDEKDQLLKKTKDFIFLTFVFPLNAVVSSVFWTLYTINQEFIIPKGLEKYLPTWMNHSLHTAIIVYAVLELLTSYHIPSSNRSHVLAITALLGSYAIWYHIVYFMTGHWIYPILSRLDWTGRIILTAVSGLIGYGSLFLGLYGNSVIWKNRVQECRKSKRK